MGHLERQQALDEELVGRAEDPRSLLRRPGLKQAPQERVLLDRGHLEHAQSPGERLTPQLVRLLERDLAAPGQVVLQGARVLLRELAELQVHDAGPR